MCACCVSPRAARHVQEEAGAFRVRVARLARCSSAAAAAHGDAMGGRGGPSRSSHLRVAVLRPGGDATQPAVGRLGVEQPSATVRNAAWSLLPRSHLLYLFFWKKKKKSVVQRGREDGREVPAEAGQSVAAAHAPQDEEDEVGWTGAVTTQLLPLTAHHPQPSFRAPKSLPAKWK